MEIKTVDIEMVAQTDEYTLAGILNTANALYAFNEGSFQDMVAIAATSLEAE